MPGSKAGGVKAAATTRRIYGDEFYKKIGSMGGKKTGINKGFSSLSQGKDGLTGYERARIAGSVGGKKSKRSKGLKKGLVW